MELISEKLLNRLQKEHQDYQPNQEYQNFIAYFANLPKQKTNIKKQEFEKSLRIMISILTKIDIDYTNEFIRMLNENNQDNPVIYVYKSNQRLDLNESLTYRHEIHFYKTNTTADIYLLLHEFTHYLINKKESYNENKINNEIAPILMEFIISKELKDNEYIKHRLNEIIFEAKSVLLKSAILKGLINLDELYIKYNMTEEEIERFETDLLYSKNLKYEEELSYIKGYIYASYYSKSNAIANLVKLIEELQVNRNIELPQINSTEINSLPKK